MQRVYPLAGDLVEPHARVPAPPAC